MTSQEALHGVPVRHSFQPRRARDDPQVISLTDKKSVLSGAK